MNVLADESVIRQLNVIHVGYGTTSVVDQTKDSIRMKILWTMYSTMTRLLYIVPVECSSISYTHVVDVSAQ